MSLNVTNSSVGATNATSPVSGTQSSDNTMKSSTDSSFKDEMEKVSTKEEKKETPKDDIALKGQNSEKADTQASTLVKAEKTKSSGNNSISDAEKMKLAALSMFDVNNNLQNDIQSMMNTVDFGMDDLTSSLLSSVEDKTFGSLFALDYTDNLSMTQADAEFFINLVQKNDVSAQAVTAQAQMAFENGTEFSQIQQNVKISETLLNAINIARENNQPLRIDFDNNIAVIMRFGKDGSFAANFIPGDKVVEQFLKNNLDSLRSTFNEKEIPYSDLSYSNRGSKHQKEQQRSQQQ